MKTNTIVATYAFLLCLMFCSCTKNETRFYEDGENDGISIFSNTGNNVMACYINGQAWRTFPRVTTSTIIFGTNTQYEITLHSSLSGNTAGYVQLFWNGSYQNNTSNSDYIILTLLSPGNTFYRYMNSLQGKRLVIDSTTGSYFTTTIGQQNGAIKKANGGVYFQTAQFDSIAPGFYTGRIAGVFEANFGAEKITKGRFDHVITREQIR